MRKRKECSSQVSTRMTLSKTLIGAEKGQLLKDPTNVHSTILFTKRFAGEGLMLFSFGKERRKCQCIPELHLIGCCSTSLKSETH